LLLFVFKPTHICTIVTQVRNWAFGSERNSSFQRAMSDACVCMCVIGLHSHACVLLSPEGRLAPMAVLYLLQQCLNTYGSN